MVDPDPFLMQIICEQKKRELFKLDPNPYQNIRTFTHNVIEIFQKSLNHENAENPRAAVSKSPNQHHHFFFDRNLFLSII